MKQAQIDLHHILEFLVILNALSSNTLSEAAVLDKSIKYPLGIYFGSLV